jgi:hypothetical protein
MRKDKKRMTMVRDSTKGALNINRNSLQESIMGFKLGDRNSEIVKKENSEPKQSDNGRG